MSRSAIALFTLLNASLVLAQTSTPAVVRINGDNVLTVNDKKVFPIGFTMPPPPDAKAPSGKMGIEEIHDAGGSFMRTGPNGQVAWDDEYLQLELRYEDAAAKYGMFCLPWLKELSAVDDKHPNREKRLREVIARFKDHPGLGCWKGEDEPEWGKKPIPPMKRVYDIIHEMDPNHPVWIVEAPRGTIDSIRPYLPTRDITGQDIYPISYPPGIHSLLPNTDISLVGDHTRFMMDATQGKMPVWMTLQVAWSGVVKPGRTLRMPSFAEERYMSYQAIINGARGLIYFGPSLAQAFAPEDEPYHWNWSYFDSVLRPLFKEIGHQSPLIPALVAPDSKLKIHIKPVGIEYGEVKEIEWCVREVDNDIYVLAASRSHDTKQVSFEGFPALEQTGEVMFERRRTVQTFVMEPPAPSTTPARPGRRARRPATAPAVGRPVGMEFTDWFAPFDVHVYKLHRKPGASTQPPAEEE